KVIDVLNLHTGAFNIEARVDKSGNIYLIEFAARNCGNYLNKIIEYAAKVDETKFIVKAALGEDCLLETAAADPRGFWSNYVIRNFESGRLKRLAVDSDFEKNNLVEFEAYCSPGDMIEAFDISRSPIGNMILKYGSLDELQYKIKHMDEFVKVELE
ncbi:MAG: hypothetical protein NC401_19805, partial [Ruminococcus sp.]|nr:hypothetical protein [Ruminococcus sp.]